MKVFAESFLLAVLAGWRLRARVAFPTSLDIKSMLASNVR
jgi:hypothetical protein